MAEIIETARLILREHTLDDFPGALSIYSDPKVVRYIGDGKIAAAQDVWHRVLRFAGHWKLLGYGMFAVIEKSTGDFVGEVGLADFHRGLGASFDPFPEAAWIMAAQAHGKGYCTEAAAAAHRWFDAHRGAARTVCIIDPDNAASLRVAEKLGYRQYTRFSYRDSEVVALERLA